MKLQEKLYDEEGCIQHEAFSASQT